MRLVPLLGKSAVKLPYFGITDSIRVLGQFSRLSLSLAARYLPYFAVLRISCLYSVTEHFAEP